ncbi:helix-turn-helix domain-containing protein [Martelella endophytica]|uniref:helix-turn-helix domain-containing protein n=1 Tax=Martelella endophytica TaxID=1486262 RepID=UPI00069642EA|nr:helix-turn-helix transcriptional regulator [Martelella endophytica]
METVTPNFKKERPRYFFKEWRKHRGLTQEELASRIGVSASSVSQLENGKQGFTDSTLEAYAWALGCNPGDLLMRNPLEENAMWSIWEDAMKADPARQQQIVDYARFLLGKAS